MRNITPTPWRIGAIESGMVAIDGANGEEVTGFVSPEDGHLIAAAPDLLAALQDVDALWMHHSIAHGDGKISPLHEKVIAAIAKATGEQP